MAYGRYNSCPEVVDDNTVVKQLQPLLVGRDFAELKAPLTMSADVARNWQCYPAKPP